MPEVKVIAEYKCPKCNGWWPRLIRFFLRKPSLRTITGEAIQPYKDAGKIPQDAEVASRTLRLPLVQPSSVALTFPVMQLCFDHCLKCGKEHLVKAVVVEAPLTVRDVPGGNPFGQMPPGFPQG